MASVFSYHTASLRYFGKPHNPLNQSPCASHSFHSLTSSWNRGKGADLSTEKNQGGFYDILQQVRTENSILVLGLGITGFVWPSSAMAEETSVSLPVEKVADYLYAVIEADREVYTKHVVERMQIKGVVVASENWEEKNTLPLPAQFLMESGRGMARKGTGHRRAVSTDQPLAD